MTQPIPAHANDARERDLEGFVRRRNTRDEPRYFSSMRETKDEFVDDAVDADGAGDERGSGVGWVREDEMLGVKLGEVGFPYAATVEVALASTISLLIWQYVA
jgi:hypothetical protein